MDSKNITLISPADYGIETVWRNLINFICMAQGKTKNAFEKI
jgi:hypothetical protein